MSTRPEPGNPAYLWDIRRAAEEIQQFAAGKTFVDYLADRQLQLAVERSLEIIGEAARNISEEFKREHPQIPWSTIVGQRNVLAHAYAEIDHERVWLVVIARIPELLSLLEQINGPGEGHT